MNLDIIKNLTVIAKKKNLSKDIVIDTLKESLGLAAKKYLGLQKNIEVEIDDDFEGDDLKKSFTIELNDPAGTRYTIPVTLSKPVMTPTANVQGRAERGVNDKGERTGK